MLRSYIAELLKFTFRGLALRAESLQILAALGLPALSYLTGWKITEDALEAIPAYIVFALLWFGLIRFITAPYFIWQRDQQTIKSVETELSNLKNADNSLNHNVRNRVNDQLNDERVSVSKMIASRLELPVVFAIKDGDALFRHRRALEAECRPFMSDLRFAGLLQGMINNHENAWYAFRSTESNVSQNARVNIGNQYVALGNLAGWAAHDAILGSPQRERFDQQLEEMNKFAVANFAKIVRTSWSPGIDGAKDQILFEVDEAQQGTGQTPMFAMF